MVEKNYLKNNSDIMTFREFYPVNPPFGHVGIEIIDEKGKLDYVSIEPHLNKLVLHTFLFLL